MPLQQPPQAAEGSPGQFIYNGGGTPAARAGSSGHTYDTTNNRPQAVNPLDLGPASDPGAASVLGGTLLYSDNKRGVPALRQVTKNGIIREFDDAFINYQQIAPQPNSATFQLIGLGISQGGTATASGAPASTNILTRARRLHWVSSAAANSDAGFYAGSNAIWRGNAAGLGGFHLAMIFGFPTLQSGSRAFFGLAPSGSFLGNGQDPTAASNMIGLGWKAGDSNAWQLIVNGGGTATHTALTNNTTVSTTDLYEFVMEAGPNGGNVFWSLRAINGGTVDSGTISTNLPSTGTFLAAQAGVNTGAGTSANTFALNSMYAEIPLT